MVINTDILIVGAGPAGCVASLAAEKYNFTSVTIERNVFPRDKICGDGLLLSDISIVFNKLGINFEQFLESKNISFCDNITISDSNNNVFNLEKKHAISERYRFDNWLWDMIEGKDRNLKFENVKIVNLKKGKSGYVATCLLGETELLINAKYIIAADGYSSFLRRFFYENLKFNSRVASRYYLKTDVFIKDNTRIYFDDEIIPGYFWVFKVAENYYNTGVYLAEGSDANVFQVHNYFTEKYFNHSINKKEFYTWPIPYNTAFENLVKENILLIGDAAGFCDKTFGHGIDNAIVSGFVAVDAIFDSLKEGVPYSLSEIYKYKTNQHIGSFLRSSEEIYDSYIENKDNFFEIIKGTLLNTDSNSTEI